MRRFKKFFRPLPTILPIAFIILGTIAVILYGRGYRPDSGGIKPTGLLSVTSDPVGAEVYIDNVLRTATDNTINVDPGWYDITISKEGYIPWQKKLRIQGEIVTRADPFLFPTNPSLSPLTNVGIENPVLSPDGTKIAYIVKPIALNGLGTQRAGLWVYELVERSLGFNRDQRQVGLVDTLINFSQADLIWSPDSAQIMVNTPNITRLYTANRTDDFQDVTLSHRTLLQTWDEQTRLRIRQQLVAFKQPIIDVATQSAKIISFSPDESKILYEATASATIPQVITPALIGTNPTEEKRSISPGKIYVYDSKEDRNYFLLEANELPKPKATASPTPPVRNVKASPSPTLNYSPLTTNLHWFPTSRHIVLTFEDKIDVIEYDRTNWITVYSGPFSDHFVAPWPNGSRIITLMNLNPGVSALPNLYTVNLR